LLFWPLVAIIIAGALSAALARHLVYAALSLGVTLTGIAGLYLFLQTEYLAVIQMIVYVGGILILILFGVMFSKDITGKDTRPSLSAWALGIAAGGITLVACLRTAWISVERGTAVPQVGTGSLLTLQRSPTETWLGNIAPDSPATLGALLLGSGLTPFLVIAILLTVVLIAALGLIRKDAP
jgi:NADH-quinone oxidoreductase subunit J